MRLRIQIQKSKIRPEKGKQTEKFHLKVKRDEIKNQIECRSARWVSFLALSAIVVSGAPPFFQAKWCRDGAGICCGVSSPGRCGSGEAGRGNQCRPLNTGSLAHRWWGLADQLSRFDAVPYILFIFQCCGAGSVGSVPMFLGLPDPDPLVRGTDPSPDPALDPYIIKQK